MASKLDNFSFMRETTCRGEQCTTRIVAIHQGERRFLQEQYGDTTIYLTPADPAPSRATKYRAVARWEQEAETELHRKKANV